MIWAKGSSTSESKMSPRGIFFRGVAMGIAEILPGVSGGTVALITGVYQRLILCLSAFGPISLRYIKRRDWIGLWTYHDGAFLLSLIAGMAVGFLSLVGIVNFLLENCAIYLWGFFFGLVSTSAFFVLIQLPLRHVLLAGIPGSIFGIAVALLPQGNLEPSMMLLFFSGMLAVTAWMLPGVSGAFVLLILGLYEPLLQAIQNINTLMLSIFMLGGIVGIFSTSRLIRWALERFRYAVVSVLIGFVVGSLIQIWPWRIDDMPVLPSNYASTEFASVIVLGLIGTAVVVVFFKLSERTV